MCNFALRSVFAAIIHDRKLVAAAVASAVSYVIAYMFITGAAVYFPDGIPEFTRNVQGLEPPMLKATWSGLYFIPSENFGSFLTYDAMVFLGITSALFGLSISLVILNRRMETSCRLPSIGMLGVVPAVFATFACCGGGVLLLALGPAIFGLISVNSPYFLAASIAAMSGGTLLLVKRADQKMKSFVLRT
jgi:hypothetical protein